MSLPLSTAIRVLVHDTASSHSVLGQLGAKDSLTLPNGSDYGIIIGRSLPAGLKQTQASEPGLVVAYFDYEGNAGFVPQYEFSSEEPAPSVDFESWWTAPAMSDDAENVLSRRNIVLTVANRAGGAHVDRRGFDLAFELLTQRGSLGYWSVHGRLLASPIPAAVRQIAEELRLAIRQAFAEDLGDLAEHISTKPTRPPGYFLGGYRVVKADDGTTHFSLKFRLTAYPPPGTDVTLIEGRTDPAKPY